jgi:hypothetical protein
MEIFINELIASNNPEVLLIDNTFMSFSISTSSLDLQNLRINELTIKVATKQYRDDVLKNKIKIKIKIIIRKRFGYFFRRKCF